MATTNTLPIRLIRTLLTAAALTALVACGGSTSAPPPAPESRPAGTAVIGSGGGQVSGADGASITLPAGALRTDATIVITRDGSEAPPLPQGFKLAGDVFALLPHGATLARPATVRLPFDATRIAANEQPAVLKASPGQPWELIEDVRVEGNTLTFETSRFSWTAIIARPRGRFLPPTGVAPPVVPPTISETDAVINLTPPTGLPRLTATGSNVQIVQQNDPAQDVSIGVSFGFGAQSAIAQACNSSGWTEPVQVSTVFSPAAIYRLPSDGNAGGINRVAVDLDAARVRRPSVALQPDDSTGDGFFNYPHVAPMYGRRYQGIESVNTAFTQWNPSSVATFSGLPQSVLPADAIVEGWGVHVTLLVLCPTNSGRASVVIPTAVQPVVVVRGFPVDDIVVTSRPPAVVSALQGELADVGASGATAPAGITLTHTWEQLTPGASSWTPVPRVPAGSLPEFYLFQSALQPNAPAGVGGVLSQALHNGTRLRFRVCGNFPPSGAERCAYSLETLLRVTQNYPLPSVVRQPSATGTATFNVGQRLFLSAEFTPQVYRGQPVWQTRRSDTEPWTPVSATEFEVLGGPSWTASVPFTSFVRASAGTVLSTADRGRQFRAVYNVPSGSVTTNPVTIQVSTGQTPPSFTAQPQDVAVAAGSPVLFAAAVTGAQPMSYRWLFNGQPILGANSPLLTLNGANAGNAGLYELEVSNVEATVRSRAARLTVTTGAPGQATAPTITTQPASVTVAAGSAVSFGVTARGTGTLSYQWRRSGTALTGATSQVLALNNVTNADAGEYSVVVSDGAGQSVTSAAAVLNVGPASPGTSVAPTISTQPIGLTASAGQTVTFAVAASGSGPLSYQWQRSGSALPNTNSPVLTLTNVQAANAGDYTVVISNSAGSVTSNAAGLVVTPVPGTPVIVTSPSDRSAFVGGTATFTATVTGNPTPQCQWTRNGVAVGGATSCASYTTPALTLADNGAIYNLVAFNAAGAVFGSGAVLSVQAPTAPAITTQPTSQTITLPNPAIFSVAFTGAPTPEIIWNINGTDLPFGAGLTFTAGACTGGYTNLGGIINLSGLSAGCNGATVRVRLSNSAGSVTSSTVTLTVNPAAVAPVITTQPTSQAITLPNPAIFSVAFTGSPTPEIIWNINGTDLPFGAGLTFTAGACTGGYTNLGGVINLSGLSAGCNGATVRVRLSNSAGSVTSSTVTLTVNTGVNVGPPASVGACFGGQFGWCYVQPAPMANRLTGLAFDSSGSGLTIVGDAGTVLTSTDFGGTVTASWQSQRYSFSALASPSPGRLVAAVDQPDDVNLRGLYLSTDGGSTWTRTAPSNSLLVAIAFRDAQVGVAVGVEQILRTTDGGSTWTALNVPAISPPNATFLTGVAHAGGDVFVASGIGRGVRSTDGGLTWSVVPGMLTANANLTGVAFNGQGLGLALNDSQPVAARSTDSGASWNTVNLPFVAARAAFAGANTIVILGGDGRHARSTDGGLTWSPEAFSLPLGQQQWRPYMRNALQGIAIGDYGAIARTEDGGDTWSQIAGGNINRTTWAIEANPSRSVLLAQINGALSRSTDGRTWTDVSGGNWTTTFRQSISWGSDTVAVAATTFEGVQITANAGDTWTRIRPPFATGTYPAAAMANAQTVVVAGYNVVNGVVESFVDRSTDAGQTWSRLNLPGLDGSGITITAVRFVTPTLGFIAGSAGTPGSTRLWRTEDAGAIWLQMTLPDVGTSNRRDNIQAIQAGPSGTIFMATDSAVLRSADTGFNWSRVLDSSAFGSMTDVRFSGSTGIAVGVGGVWRTDNGAAWTRLDLPLSGALLSTAWGPAGLVLAGGDGGTLLANQSLGNLAVRPDNPVFRQTLRLGPAAAGGHAASPSKRPAGAADGKTAPPDERARALLQPPPLKSRVKDRSTRAQR